MLPLAIGAVVLGVPCTFQTPLCGQLCPVCAVVPIGRLELAVLVIIATFLLLARFEMCALVPAIKSGDILSQIEKNVNHTISHVFLMETFCGNFLDNGLDGVVSAPPWHSPKVPFMSSLERKSVISGVTALSSKTNWLRKLASRERQ